MSFSRPDMTLPANITCAIVDALYQDALALSEEARIVFDMDGHETSEAEMGMDMPGAHRYTPRSRIAASCEALRTTTRLMHALAWLLNHKAHLNGEMSEFQLRRRGHLPPAEAGSDAVQIAMLDRPARNLVERSHAFYARVARIDAAWKKHYTMQPAAIHRLRDRLGEVFAVS
jgi:regulator of CtrA degradation